MDKNNKFKLTRNPATEIYMRWLGQMVSGLTVLTLIGSSHAGSWNYTPGIYVSTTYTDNVFLTPKGTETDELIFEISPSINVTRAGKQLDLSFDYRLQGLLYSNDDARNEAYSYLSASANSRVIPDLLFLDVYSSISQTVIDPRAGIGNSSISVSGNTSEVMNLNISPYIQRKLGAYTVIRAGYRGGLVEYDEPQLFDSQQNELFASLVNDGGAGIFNWKLDYNERSVDYDFGRKIELSTIGGEVGVRFGPRTELVLAAGEDTNNVGALGGTRVAEGSYWNVGLRGGIGDRTEYEFRIGEQFFGDSYSARFRRETQRVTTQFTYTEAATTIGAQQLDYSNAFSFINDVLGVDLPSTDPSLYIRKRFDLTGELRNAKSSWKGSVYYEDRDFIRTTTIGAREQALGVGLEWQWQFDDITSVHVASNITRLNSRDGVSRPQDFRVRLNLRRTLFDSTYATAGIWRNSRSANFANQEYIENGISLGLGRQF